MVWSLLGGKSADLWIFADHKTQTWGGEEEPDSVFSLGHTVGRYFTRQQLTHGVADHGGKLEAINIPANFFWKLGIKAPSRGVNDKRRRNRQTKNQGPKRYGSPVSHSVKLISCEDDVTEINLAALEAYRTRLANLNLNNKKKTPENNTFNLLERHLFKRKFGATSLDDSGSWNAARNKAEVKKNNKGN